MKYDSTQANDLWQHLNERITELQHEQDKVAKRLTENIHHHVRKTSRLYEISQDSDELNRIEGNLRSLFVARDSAQPGEDYSFALRQIQREAARKRASEREAYRTGKTEGSIYAFEAACKAAAGKLAKQTKPEPTKPEKKPLTAAQKKVLDQLEPGETAHFSFGVKHHHGGHGEKLIKTTKPLARNLLSGGHLEKIDKYDRICRWTCGITLRRTK